MRVYFRHLDSFGFRRIIHEFEYFFCVLQTNISRHTQRKIGFKSLMDVSKDRIQKVTVSD